MLLLRQFCPTELIFNTMVPYLGKIILFTDFWSGPCDVINDVIKVSVSNGHISATDRPIDFVFDHRIGFSGTADWMDLLPVVPNARFGRPPSWKISNDHISGQHTLRNLWSCGWWFHLSQMVTVQGNPHSAHTSSPTGLLRYCTSQKARL